MGKYSMTDMPQLASVQVAVTLFLLDHLQWRSICSRRSTSCLAGKDAIIAGVQRASLCGAATMTRSTCCGPAPGMYRHQVADAHGRRSSRDRGILSLRNHAPGCDTQTGGWQPRAKSDTDDTRRSGNTAIPRAVADTAVGVRRLLSSLLLSALRRCRNVKVDSAAAAISLDRPFRSGLQRPAICSPNRT